MLDNRCRSIWNLLIAALSFWPASQTDCPIDSWVKAVNSVITRTWSDNLPAVLRTHSLLHMCCIAVTAFLIQPWVLCCALIHLMGSRGRLITTSDRHRLLKFWPTTIWNITICTPLKDECERQRHRVELSFFFSTLSCNRIVSAVRSHFD